MIARDAFIAVLGFCIAPAAFAQAVPPPDSTIGAFDQLATGEQKIARSLFESQTATASGPAPMSLDQIAAARGGGESGWGNVFKQMQSDGLIDARNLGQVVSGHYRPSVPEGSGAVDGFAATGGTSAVAGAASSRTAGKEKVVVTTASGRTISTDSNVRGTAGKSAVAKEGMTTASSGRGGYGSSGVQTASGGGNGGGAAVNSGKGGQSANAGIMTANGSTAGGAAGGSAGGKAVGHSK